MLKMRFFAVGAAKGWTQIRAAKKPPVASTSEVVTNVKKRQLYWDDISFNYRHKLVDQKLRMKVTVFTGGRTLWTIKSSSLARTLKASVREGGMVELMPEQVAAIREMTK
jgi:hypothetical protein